MKKVIVVLALLVFVGGCRWPFAKKFPFRDGGRIASVNTPNERERWREEGRGKWAYQWKSGKPRYGPAPKQPEPHGYSGVKSMFRRR